MASREDKHCLWFSVSLPKEATGWDWISVLYGYTPFVWLLYVFVVFVVKRRDTRQLSYLLQIAFVFGINEFCKAIIDEPRPQGACGKSSGMPSSHAAMAVGSLTAVTLDLVSIGGKRTIFDSLLWAAMAALLLPVPLSRVVLRDHSVQQAMAGTFSGMLTGSLWFLLIARLRQANKARLGKALWGTFIIHNYAPIGEELPPNDSETVLAADTKPEDLGQVTNYGSTAELAV